MIDLAELREVIRRMTPRQAIYRLLKEELSARGRWKYLPRGKPNIYNLCGKMKRVE